METWKDIPGFEGLYQVSDLGRVRSLDRVIERLHKGKLIKQPLKGQILRPAPYTKQGHLSTPLGRRSNGIPVHQMVMSAFVGPCPEGQEVLHGNGLAWDNKLTNISYGTRSQNNRDITSHGKRKLTRQQAADIRLRFLLGENMTRVAEEYKVSRSLITEIIHNRQYV